MLTFFRRLINSRVGLIVTFIVLGLIALAFAAGDITGLQNTGGTSSGTVATVGRASLTATELRSRLTSEVEAFRREQPTLDMAQFIAGGGFEGTLGRLINGLALHQFGEKSGLAVSKASIDGEIASIPGLQGPDGKFSEAIFQRLLADRRLTPQQVREDIARETIVRYLTAPTAGASQVSRQLAIPYASLLLEKRAGQIAFVPTQVMGAGARPTAAEIDAFLAQNRARYTIPERRIIRYALVAADQVKAAATATEAEIRKAYQDQAGRFAATEKRTLAQVVIADKAAADALAAKVKGGTPIADAARAIGLEAATLAGVERGGYAGQTSVDIANSVFTATQGGIVGPLRAPLGWVVVRVDAIEKVPARTLDQVRGELAEAVAREKGTRALADVHDRIDDAINDNATFSEIVADQKLKAEVTQPVLADGRNPANPAATPDPRFKQIIDTGFAAEPDDDPQIAAVGEDGSFAVVALERVVPASVPPRAALLPVLERDFAIDRARRAARKVAAGIVAAVNKGTSLKDAVAKTGLALPPLQELAATRAQFASDPRRVPPPIALMFSMTQGSAKLQAAPEDGGWYIIHLDSIQRTDASGNTPVVTATRSDIGRVIGSEYVAQFAMAVRREIGVKRNEPALAKVRAELAGEPATVQP